jgi:Arc/MetJ-type ribon-helix-helix transcriptional regulator
VSVSLRPDEENGIQSYIEEHPKFKTRHEVIKYAIRRLVLPNETDVSVNGRSIPAEEKNQPSTENVLNIDLDGGL